MVLPTFLAEARDLYASVNVLPGLENENVEEKASDVYEALFNRCIELLGGAETEYKITMDLILECDKELRNLSQTLREIYDEALEISRGGRRRR